MNRPDRSGSPPNDPLGGAVGDRLFVYGTLKRGQCAHHLLGPSRHAEAAAVLGRLWLHADGYPVLEVPDETILADAHSLHPLEVAAHADAYGSAAVASAGLRSGALVPRGRWRPIRGELVRLHDAGRRWVLLDRYEGCRAGAAGPYRRVLVRAWTTAGTSLAPVATAAVATTAWVYVAGPAVARSTLVPLGSGAWSPAAGTAAGRGAGAHGKAGNRGRVSCRRSRSTVK